MVKIVTISGDALRISGPNDHRNNKGNKSTIEQVLNQLAIKKKKEKEKTD